MGMGARGSGSMDTPLADIDGHGREKFVRLAELSSEDHVLVRDLQRDVIAAAATDIIDVFYERLRDQPEFEAILSASGARSEALKETYRRYLQSFGVDFEGSDYFRERLRIGAIHAAVGVPLRLYVAAGRLLQRLIIEHVFARFRDDRRGRALTDLVLKLTTLDTALVIEAYHGTHVSALESSVEALRTRGERLMQDLATDTLTGVASRRSVMQTLKETLDQSRHHAECTGLILLDLDHFKAINDRHGHRTGDEILQVSAARIRSSLRSIDTVGRYGGEEFLIILPAAGKASSKSIAERVRRSLSADPINASGVPVRVTASQGIAISNGSEDTQTVIERADSALYAAKRAGRDCIVSADDYL